MSKKKKRKKEKKRKEKESGPVRFSENYYQFFLSVHVVRLLFVYHGYENLKVISRLYKAVRCCQGQSMEAMRHTNPFDLLKTETAIKTLSCMILLLEYRS